MVFNSIDFALFLPIVFAIFWLLKSSGRSAQNVWLFAASYFFYGWWDWRFLSLIFVSTVVDYVVGLKIHQSDQPKTRKAWLAVSLVVNLGFLAFFKYFNFFVGSFVDAFSLLGTELDSPTLYIILPVGISFYTFQTLSYSLDIYWGKLTPTRDFIAFGAFVSFFPQLVAGPIERASHLLPQFQTPRRFSYRLAVDGTRQILWGLFKKVAIADNVANYVNDIFQYHEGYRAPTLLLGAVLFAFQIYCDFSGYSDMAIGTARLFGFDLKKNFAFPYFSRNIGEFWRRWHISLSTWFRDYLYIPLGGSRGNRMRTLRNTFIIFLVSGFWHGANWTFVIWGAFHAVLFIPLLLARRNRTFVGDVAGRGLLPSVRELIQILVTFGLVTIGWIFFRAPSVGEAWSYLLGILTPARWGWFDYLPMTPLVMIALLLAVEWLGRRQEFGLALVAHIRYGMVRKVIYMALVALIIWKGNFGENPFIYFQF